MRTQRRSQRAKTQNTRASKTYFFSDAHLGLGTREEDRAKEDRIVKFLDQVRKDAAQLFILGDLFDYWFEYKTVVPKGYFRLFAKLADLSAHNIPITYLAGNHDFWMKNYFTEELGIDIIQDPIERIIAGKRFYLHHGDGLVKDDAGYRFLKRVLRNKANIWLFSLLHPDLTSALARWSSRTSRKHTSGRKYEQSDMDDFAEQKIAEGYDVVIMGHNHQSRFRKFGRGVYVNLGDWIHENTYAVFDGKRIELKQWTSNHA
jgi:UDP-2,3-diacylglucosamine hydrolase